MMLKNVQALRAAAAMLVVFDHINGEVSKSDPGTRTIFDPFRYIGNAGVDMFFVISGFIMVATTWENFGRPGVSRTFLLRRFARIYPPYWFVMVPILAVYLLAAHSLMHAHEGQGDIVSSLLLLPQAHEPLLIVSWTLTFEVFFYGVFSGILKMRRGLLVPLLALWFALELVLSMLLHGARNPYLGFLSLPLPIEFILGALIGVAYRRKLMPAARVISICGMLAFAAAWVASATPFHADLSKNDIWRVLQFGIPCVVILYGAVGMELARGSRAPSWTVSLGDASYAIYLWHVPITIVLGSLAMRMHVRGIGADTIAQAISLVIVLVVSLAVYRYFERPVTAMLNSWIAVSGRERLSRAVSLRVADPPVSASEL